MKPANVHLQNRYIPKRNKECAEKPAAGFDARLNLRRLDPDAIYSIQRPRAARRGCAFSIGGRVFRIGREDNLSGPAEERILAEKRILAEERPDGTIRARRMERCLAICETGGKYRKHASEISRFGKQFSCHPARNSGATPPHWSPARLGWPLRREACPMHARRDAVAAPSQNSADPLKQSGQIKYGDRTFYNWPDEYGY
jgi:hypothetical protein